jgi:hypothetical protein
VETFTSRASGLDFWAGGQTTWNEAGTPTAADNFVINGHLVNYGSDTPAGGHSGTVTLNGGVLRLTGTRSFLMGNNALTFGAGSALQNAGGIGTLQIGTAHSQANSRVAFSGNAGSHVSVAGESAANYIQFTNGSFIRGGKCDAQYVDFAKVAPAGNCFQIYPSAADTFQWLNCTFDANCGVICSPTAVLNGAAIFRIEDCVHNGTVQNIHAGLTQSSSPLTTGVRTLVRLRLRGSMGNQGNGGAWKGFTIKSVTCKGVLWVSASQYNDWAVYENNVVRVLASVSMNLGGPLTNAVGKRNLFHLQKADGTVQNNPKGIGFHVLADQTLQGVIIEPGNTGQDGDLIFAQLPASPKTYIVVDTLILPRMQGGHAGQAISLVGNANDTVKFERMTYCSDLTGGESGAVSAGETYPGYTGMIPYGKNCMVWSNVPNGGYVYQRRNLGSVSDIVAAANLNHNGKWQLSAGNQGVNGYTDSVASPTQPMFSSTTGLGNGDVVFTADPFKDKSRRMSTWAVDRGYSTSSDYHQQCEDAYEALFVDPEARNQDMIEWIWDGWTVVDTKARKAADDGTHDLGACGGSFATTFTLSGAATGVIGTPITITVTPVGGRYGNTTQGQNVTLSNAGSPAGTFSATVISYLNESGAKTVQYTPTAAGTHLVSMANDWGITNGTTLSISVSPGSAIAGVTSAVAVDQTQITVSDTPATGTGTISYQRYASESQAGPFVPIGLPKTAASGIAPASETFGLLYPGNNYWWFTRATDSAVPATFADSTPVQCNTPASADLQSTLDTLKINILAKLATGNFNPWMSTRFNLITGDPNCLNVASDINHDSILSAQRLRRWWPGNSAVETAFVEWRRCQTRRVLRIHLAPGRGSGVL